MKKILPWIIFGVIFAVVLGGAVYFLQQKEKPAVPPPVTEEKPEEKLPLPEQEREKISLPAGTTKEPSPEAAVKVETLEKGEKVLPQRVECNLNDYRNPKGRIFLSLKKDGEVTSIFEFDPQEKKLTEFLKDPKCDSFVLSLSKDNDKIVFVSQCPGEKEVITWGKSDKTDLKKINVPLSDDERKNAMITRPVFSPDGQKIAFLLQRFVSDIWAESWTSYVIDLQGNILKTLPGSMPLFSPDGKSILLVRNPGIYKINLDTNESERVIEFRDKEGNLLLNKFFIKVSLSPDGKKLAVSDFSKPAFHVFEIESWEPFKYKLLAQMNIVAAWSAFSPDGKYLALQEADEVTPEGMTNPRLSIFETCSFTKLFTFDLKGYSSSDMWVSDWR
jgi:WD40 repeat protein